MLARYAPLRVHHIIVRGIPVRPFSTTKLPNGITLAYDLHEPPNTAQFSQNAPPIIFMHGLFGSKKNNRSMSKYAPMHTSPLKRPTTSNPSTRIFARDLNRPVYALDLRNHGDSSHNATHDYTSMASDVEAFIQENKLEYSTLIGHSMGAKTAMTVALRGRVPIADVIPVDNAPVDAALKSDFGKYMQGMRRIAESNCKRQSDADAILQNYEDSLPIRQFLLTNMVRDPETGVQKWRIPIDVLGRALDRMADFPFKDPEDARFGGRTLFVRGTKSHYVADEMLPIIGRFFPKFQVADVEAGHWLISEKPEEFRRVVVEFLQNKE
ncbi:hypothetical protein LTR62_006988 [Meristemomyces frigidus]|uniref:AB hydrolase-1 domain-containing protein n=1 Tax=Meristemomyces frigidus TaxID=1508187 RepID=A0AAN7TBZ9_9PEZI|nr:hypothetical protein LTR62_006988 [Meristemomyces frigidus]